MHYFQYYQNYVVVMQMYAYIASLLPEIIDKYLIK